VCIIFSNSIVCFSELHGEELMNNGPENSIKNWFHKNTLARTLSQISDQEYAVLAGNRMIDLAPVMLPRPEYVVTNNNYFDWPIAVQIQDTVIVLFSRRKYHWGRKYDKEPRSDENSGIRMITRSSDRGTTWSDPVDVIEQAGQWEKSLFGGWGGGLGAHNNTVYLALNEGIYRSDDKGATWKLATKEPDFSGLPENIQPVSDISINKNNKSGTAETAAPLWSPGMRLTFDSRHGLVIWSTRAFKPKGRDGKTNTDYGKYLCAVYSPDFGRTWQFHEQALPKGLYLNEITPLQFKHGTAFFLRNGIRHSYYGQGFSASGWFPFTFKVSNVGPVYTTDTPDLIFNPESKRLEAAATFRNRKKPMELHLYSITPEEIASGSAEWRFDGVLLQYQSRFGKSDGMNPVGGIADTKAGVHRIYIWAGDGKNRAGIFEYRRTLDTASLRNYLLSARKQKNEKK
jgi:hypothetical protein